MTDSTTQQGDTTADFDVSRPNFNSTAFADDEDEAPRTPSGYSLSAKRSVFRGMVQEFKQTIQVLVVGPKASPILRSGEGAPGELSRRQLLHHAVSPLYSPNQTCDASQGDLALQASLSPVRELTAMQRIPELYD